jgi:hypothetical protein
MRSPKEALCLEKLSTFPTADGNKIACLRRNVGDASPPRVTEVTEGYDGGELQSKSGARSAAVRMTALSEMIGATYWDSDWDLELKYCSSGPPFAMRFSPATSGSGV